MEDKQAITLWAVGATILSIVLFFAWSNADNKLNTANNSGEYSIEDVLYEAEHNYEITRQIVRDYNLLIDDEQDKKTMDDLKNEATKGMRAQLKDGGNESVKE